MKHKPNRNSGFRPNQAEIHGTTFSSDTEKDRAPLVGREAITVTTLKPTGQIQLDGRFYDAVAQNAFIEAAHTVRVIGTRDFRLIVELVA